MAKQIILSLFIDKAGHDLSAWRHPSVPADGIFTYDYYAELARKAEQAKFDMVFLADSLTLLPEKNSDYTTTFYLEPTVLLSSLIGATKSVGLAATYSTTYTEPLHVARKFATIDLLSNGRAAWNVITSQRESEALNFGLSESYDHKARYSRAQEFVDIVQKLWRSWDADALILDKKTGRFADSSKIRPIDHSSKHFTVKGPLNVPRSRQGEPVIVQAGASEIGRAFAARNAEVIFASTPNLQSAQVFYGQIRDSAIGFGRDPNAIKILPGVIPIVGATTREAEEKHQFIKSLLLHEAAVRYLSQWLEYDVSDLDPDSPLPEIFDVDKIRGQKGRFLNILQISKAENLTLRQLAARVAATRTHATIVGHPEQVATEMQHWVEQRGCDGFNVLPTHFPEGLDDFASSVVPILQERCVFRKDYEKDTLRENLGLSR